MSWSTRQLADLAGTTVKAVRYYHQVGLLAEPERASNGYKQYEVTHLVRLLRIRRLIELGVPLERIRDLDGGPGAADPQAVLRTLDAELAATIDRLQSIRSELALVLTDGAAVDLPGSLHGVADLTDADRALLLVYSRVLSPEAMAALRTMLLNRVRTTEDSEFDTLAPDASADVIADLAQRYAPQVARLSAETAWIAQPGPHLTRGAVVAAETISESLATLYSPAQLAVMRRVREILGA